MKVNQQIKPFLANLLRLDIIKYVRSDAFRFLMLELKMDMYWEKKLIEHKRDSLHIPKRFENAFIDLLSTIYENNRALFYNVVSHIIVDFAKINTGALNFSSTLNQLVTLGIEKQNYNVLVNNLTIINHSKSASRIDNIKITENGIFIPGQHFDALYSIDNIFETANTSIILIDGYIDKKTIEIFKKKKKSVKINILTKKTSLAKVALYVNAFNEQYGGLQIKDSEAFHDRFIIIDVKQIYTLGASIKDMGKKIFMFSAINEKWIKETIIAKYNECWNSENSTS